MMMPRGAESVLTGGRAGDVAGKVAAGALVRVIGLATGVRGVCFVEVNCCRFALANLRGVAVLERERARVPGLDANWVALSSNISKGIASTYTKNR